MGGKFLAAGLSRRGLIASAVGSAFAFGYSHATIRHAAAAVLSAVNAADLDVITLAAGGIDTRTPDQPENTDVLKIARIDVPNKLVRIVAIPRDLYCEIPGFPVDKITRAYDYGSKANGGSVKSGLRTVRDTITHNFGVETDGAVFSTFQGFMEIVNTFGGVDVNNPYDVYDAQYPTFDYGYKEIYYPAGPNHLNGEQALEFCRTRHQDGDDGRVMRQALVLRALLNRAADPSIGPELPDLITTHRSAVRTDLGRSKQQGLALVAPDFSNDGVAFATLSDYIYPDTAPNGAWIYSGDWSQIPSFVQNFLAGA